MKRPTEVPTNTFEERVREESLSIKNSFLPIFSEKIQPVALSVPVEIFLNPSFQTVLLPLALTCKSFYLFFYSNRAFQEVRREHYRFVQDALPAMKCFNKNLIPIYYKNGRVSVLDTLLRDKNGQEIPKAHYYELLHSLLYDTVNLEDLDDTCRQFQIILEGRDEALCNSLFKETPLILLDMARQRSSACLEVVFENERWRNKFFNQETMCRLIRCLILNVHQDALQKIYSNANSDQKKNNT